jgi:hypothetical protein
VKTGILSGLNLCAVKPRFPPCQIPTLYVILFIGLFPALWLFNWRLDSVWPGTSELLKMRGESPKMPDADKL